jgi:ankyrin repeat protein
MQVQISANHASRVIFTVKDYQGQVIAQVMTQSILITDDHKTHTQGINGNGLSAGESGQFAAPQFSASIQPHGLPGRAYHSSTNLAGMGQPNFWGNMPASNLGQTSMTPRNLSRPASPSGHTGPKKKRKGSGGQHKLPANLQMTRADLQPLSIPPGASSAASMNPVISPDAGIVSFDTTPQFGQINSQGHFGTNPPTPHGNMPSTTRDGGFENQNYFYSAPNSAHASRAASPTSFARMNNFAAQQTQLPSATATPFAMQFAAEEQQHTAPPIIYKVRPERGPMHGNIEVVILGKNFHKNLDAKFGENIATTTTFWNSDTLVCLLPPSIRAGPVAVTLVDSRRQGYSPPTSTPPIFTYIDDNKQNLFEMAIQLQCNAELGPGANHWDYAQSLLNNHGSQTGFVNGQASGYTGNILSTSGGEDIIMAMINKVDLIDSPFKPYFDMQRENGATMLSLACSLGYEKLVAGLLARGAHPDISDVGGFTPLMFAAMHGHTAIVRRLILRGADSNLRTLSGRTASELARTPEVASSLRHVRHHFRSVSAGTPYLRSRANSAASTRSLWGPPSSGASSTMFSTDDESALDSSDDEEPEIMPLQLASRRPSAIVALRSRRNSNTLDAQEAAVLVPPPSGTYGAYANASYAGYAAMLSAFRDQLTAQINQLPQLPQSANWTLPNMEFWQDQNFPAIGRRISSLVPTLSTRADPAAADQTSADPPPSYYEACPDGADNDFDTKPPEIFAPIAESSRSASVATIRPARAAAQGTVLRERPLAARGVTIGKTSPTGEEAAELRRLREEKLTPAKYDRNLWSIWVCIFTL